ncbi:MAG TPA: hypothetical protein VLC94_00265 [Candidatus Acidoferrum sp.]|nr:hypothetical protein [Candidatus Acidoferrum sp.]
MNPIILAVLFAMPRTVAAMCGAGVALFVIGLWAAKSDIARASGLDKIAALRHLCFAIPLAVFGALHLSSAKFVMPLVPAYVPGRLFWTYFVGVALVAAALSIATKIQVRWSGLLFGIMMLVFEALVHIPRVAANPRDRFAWVVMVRELSFAGGAWVLAGSAMRGAGGNKLASVGRVLVGIAAVFFSVWHFLHPTACPGVPLQKLMPAWVPGHLVIGYLTGAILLVAGMGILLAKKTRMAATYLGAWLLLLVIFIYGPILIAQLQDANVGVQIEGINYFADTLLFAGAVLSLAVK